MRRVLFAGLAGVISLVSLLAGSGIGQAYNLYPIAMIVVYAGYALFPLHSTLLNGQVRGRELFLTIALGLIMCLWPAMNGHKTLGLEYVWLLLLPYLLGRLEITEKDAKAMGFAAGMFGLVVVASRILLGVFGNWNRNDIAMVGFLGCAVCTVAPWSTWGEKIFHKSLLVIMALLVLQLDSRSCLIGIAILAAFSFGILKPSYFAKKKWIRRLVLILPALIAVGTVLFQNSTLFDDINTWSMEYFSKPVFNGRNSIWDDGLRQLVNKPWLGSGYINNGYWHNCAVSALTAFGVLGYAAWIWYFENIMVDASKWKNDMCLQCGIAAFLTIMVQQSFELGLISTTGSMVPYMILGIMLGRMRHLKRKAEKDRESR